MASTTPSQAVVDKWVSQKYNIECEVDGSCTNGEGRIRLSSSHFKNTGIYSSYEQRFEDSEGGETVIRTLGVFGQLFEMESSKLWEMLN
ncbi:hypothetical protein [Guptibacillus algicola]|uniref:hypothetical protein n=1 Tax=Guptibacillus algicola TaxID=225844 RepID=UPI001CD5F8CF|nr:hypothetical protein [Alkalihalobacillus algicola]MCA0986496.1 hypothetical protein [Alkalihalobacillus algicola]